MFWSSGGETPEQSVEAGEGRTGPIVLVRDAPRPATILRVASELEERGGDIQELFKEIECPWGQVVLPIHLLQGEQAFFVEVETGPWDPQAVEGAINKAAVLRSSEHAEAGLELLSAYPVPKEVGFFFGWSPAALLQLVESRLEALVLGAHREQVGHRRRGVAHRTHQHDDAVLDRLEDRGDDTTEPVQRPVTVLLAGTEVDRHQHEGGEDQQDQQQPSPAPLIHAWSLSGGRFLQGTRGRYVTPARLRVPGAGASVTDVSVATTRSAPS
jgi:hypothetical protein